MRDTSEVIAACPFCSDALEMAGAGYMHPLNNGTRPFCLLSGMTVLPDHIEFWNRRPAAEPADAGRVVAWDWAFKDGVGAGVWRRCSDDAVEYMRSHPDRYELRALYTRPPSKAAAVDEMPGADAVIRERDCTDEAARKFYAKGWNECRAALASQQAMKS